MSFINKLKLTRVYSQGWGLRGGTTPAARPSLAQGPIPAGLGRGHSALQRAPGAGGAPAAGTEPPRSSSIRRRARGRPKSVAASSQLRLRADPRLKRARDTELQPERGSALGRSPEQRSPPRSQGALQRVVVVLEALQLQEVFGTFALLAGRQVGDLDGGGAGDFGGQSEVLGC